MLLYLKISLSYIGYGLLYNRGMTTQAHVYVIGDVIGVGFRAWTKIQAKQLGIVGWVRNVFTKPEVFGNSGGVEAIVQGEEEKVEAMVARLQDGSPVSRVDDIQVYWQKPQDIMEIFEIRK